MECLKYCKHVYNLSYILIRNSWLVVTVVTTRKNRVWKFLLAEAGPDDVLQGVTIVLLAVLAFIHQSTEESLPGPTTK